MIGALATRDGLKRHGPLLLGCLLVAALPLFGGSYAQRVFTLAGIYALLVMGYQLIFGHAGAFSLAQGAFFGLGAYATGIAAVRFGWPFLPSFGLSLAIPLAIAALVAIPVLRLQSHYFALATLGLAETAWLIGTNWSEVTGGANGLPGVPPIAVAGWTIARGWPLLLFVWTLVAIGAAVASLLTRGFAGLSFRLLRERPLAASAAGIDSGRLRTLAFVASAAYAGAAGALFAHSLGVVSPDTLAFPVMVSCLTMAVIGGRARIAGAILGAVLLIHLPEWLRGLETYYLIAYGAVALAVVIAAPDGLIGVIERLRSKRPVMISGLPDRPPLRMAPGGARENGAAILSLDGVTKSFGGVRAVDGLSLAVMPREILGLIGPNGSGKTTLVNLITGLYRADCGRIRFEGQDITERLAFDIARLGVSRGFQTPELIDELSLLDNVAAGDGGRRDRAPLRQRLSLDDRRLDMARARAFAALIRLGIADRANELAGALGPAFRRRAEIARALMLEPRLLVLDEPSAGSSATEAAQLAAIIRDLARDGMTLLVIDHNLPFLASFATRLACLEVGRLIAQGAPAEVRAHPRVIDAYLGRPTGAA